MRWYISRKLSGADALPSLWNGGWKGHRIPPLASLIPVKVHFTSLYLLGCSDFGYGFHGIAWNSVCFFPLHPQKQRSRACFGIHCSSSGHLQALQEVTVWPGPTNKLSFVMSEHTPRIPKNLRVDQLIIISSLQFFVLRDRIPSFSEKPTSKINRSSAIFGTRP